MSIREEIEATERQTLSPFASLSANSRGRARYEDQDNIRTVYMRDRDRITHCKAFRRLKDKTQVFLSPTGDHYRTRLTHTLEVSQIARTIARALNLNQDLVEAIALGHDLGHTPFGHAGERALNAISPYGFHHYEQSVRVVDLLEKDGRGLNLTWEVRDGILNHQMHTTPATMEGKVVRLADKFAYMHHDCDDACRAGIIREEDIHPEIRAALGGSSIKRLDTMVTDVIVSSAGKDDICMSDEGREAIMALRTQMFEDVYTNLTAKREELKVERLIRELYDYYLDNLDRLSTEYQGLLEKGEAPERVVCDYISGMTDRYCIRRFEQIFVPLSWNVL